MVLDLETRTTIAMETAVSVVDRLALSLILGERGARRSFSACAIWSQRPAACAFVTIPKRTGRKAVNKDGSHLLPRMGAHGKYSGAAADRHGGQYRQQFLFSP